LNRTSDPDPYLSPLEIAEELGLSDQTIYNWIREKKLPATKIGRALRIRRSDLERMIAAHSTTSPELGEDAFWGDPNAQGFQPPGRSR
jgi:putative molybdopterin biosynthesis protein